MKRVKKQKSKERETHSCCIHYSVKKRKLHSAINGKKKEEKTKRKTEEEAATEDESVISDGVGNLFAAASTMRRSYFVVFFFFFFFFLGTFLLFWFFFFPYKSLCSRFEIIRSPSNLCSSSCSFISFSFLLDLIITSYQCIGQNSLEKLKQKETIQTSKTSYSSQNRTVRLRFARVPAIFLYSNS